MKNDEWDFFWVNSETTLPWADPSEELQFAFAGCGVDAEDAFIEAQMTRRADFAEFSEWAKNEVPEGEFEKIVAYPSSAQVSFSSREAELLLGGRRDDAED